MIGSWSGELRAKAMDGQTFPVLVTSSPVKDKDGKTIGLLGTFKAITELKRAQEALRTYHEKLKSLASELSLAEEWQRRRVAIEVHDRISQNLAFVKMKLGTLRASTASSSLAGAMEEMLSLVDETIQNTRALISELGSPVLYELGFVPAVEWLTQQTQKQHGIVLAFEDDGQPKPLSEDVRVLLFQAVRELLVNIAKHAQARTAKVSIRGLAHRTCGYSAFKDQSALRTPLPGPTGYGLRNGVTGNDLFKSLIRIYHQHNMREWLDRRSMLFEDHPIPRIVCSEGLV